ncbi:MAG TPA: M1 family peptidase, partial [Ginsengibacter sp.]|nr:M1 family peptidase [Ginsengibacter sp.]
NDKPVIGFYGVNNEGSGDMYYKGANMIHTIRQVIDNDEKFRAILRGLNQVFRRQTVTGKMVEDYISKQAGIDFSPVFHQYLETVKIPELAYKTVDGKLWYKWDHVADDFKMPVRVFNDAGALVWLYPTTEFAEAPSGVSTIKVDKNFYVKSKKIED